MERNSAALLPGEGAVDRLGYRMDEDAADAAAEAVPMEMVEENLTPAGCDAVPHGQLHMSDGANEVTNGPSPEKASHLPSYVPSKLTKEQLKAQLVKIVVGKDRSPEASWRSREQPALTEATNEDLHEVKVAVHETFEQHRGNLRMVSVTAQVCQEEAMARLLADLLNYDLLPAEAFAIGEEARDAHREYKGKPRKGKSADQRLKDAASTAKSKARAAAAKDAGLAAGLEQRLEDIDAVLASDRRELARKVPPLSWPARDTVVHLPRPRTAAEVDRVAVTKWQRLEAAAKAAEAEAEAAKQMAALAAQEAERAERSHARLGPCPTLGYLLGTDLPAVRVGGKLVPRLEMPQGEREYRQLDFERWASSQELCHELRSVALEEKFAAREARERAEDAREEADAAAAECSSAHWAAEAELKAAEAAQANAAAAVCDARIAEMEARIAELEIIEREKKRRWVKTEAARAWPEGERPAPKVFNLVGMSAGNVRAVAGEVSQS